jgi:ubiquinone biosynthesis monooxygenase Coq7
MKLFQHTITLSKIIGRRGLHGANQKLDSILRVNHAGELGADCIYAGQMAVLGMKIK